MSKYYIGVTRLILRDPSFKDILAQCGLTVLEEIDPTDPEKFPWGDIDLAPLVTLGHPVYLLVEDPAAGPELEGKCVEVTFQQDALAPDAADSAAMPTLANPKVKYSYKIIDRRIA